ncbi:minichromosome maintenance protein 10 [Trypanosoma rangeli]|uniref:Minichromosome maintenance protein 10 n=1 Tax=Trypanosoma rangeli TaxID=5698 RepID=A0A422P3S7_TRYRA|nr:minichromosome maintenance protein 10 [Trypanosoma rangeli]RNF12352.1 minichromosome maintenance protein 10 [Trypanosoma rangeli]|eukprot:RNF12352.1 minichromosome maintenance protein 10 [Trypanosoma rangeli]
MGGTRHETGAGVDEEEEEDPFAVFNTPEPAVVALTPPEALSPLTSGGHNVAREAAPAVSGPSLWGGRGVSVAEALGRAAPSASSTIMHVVSASPREGVDTAEIVKQRSSADRARAAAMQEPSSGITVKHPTKSCEQLSLVLVQYPYATFIELHRRLAAVGAPPSLTVIGVVIRKTDPRQKNGKNTYGIVTLWSLRGPFPTPREELSVLLGGSAFDVHYTKIATGIVLALSGVQLMDRRNDAAASNTQTGTAALSASATPRTNAGGVGNNPSGLVKVTNSEQVRALGYAADLATCQAIQHHSGERCNRIVNGALSKFCSNHVSNLRRAACGNAASATAPNLQLPARVTRPSTTFASGATRVNLVSGSPTGAVASKVALQSLVRQQPGFLTVKGSCGLPTTTPAGSDVTSAAGAYAGVVSGSALSVTGMCRDVGRVFSSPQSLGVTSRGRTVLAAAVDQEDAKERQRLLQLAIKPNELGTKRSRSGSTAAVMNAKETVAQDVEAVREQYAPLPGDRTPYSFASMRCSAFEEVRLRHQDYQHRVVTRRANGKTSSIVSAVERRLRSDGTLAKAGASLVQTEKEEVTPHSQDAAPPISTSLLSAVAGVMGSVNDDLRVADERRKFEHRMERRILQDKALDALAEVTEQTVKGIYCQQCERWYLRRNERCKMLQHTLETKETTRRFIECEHCGYKTSLLGDVRPSKMVPRCPRCCADAVWKASNAAPASAASRKDSIQL